MHVVIPIAGGLLLSDGQTYNGQLPVWATRPIMIIVLPDNISGNTHPVYVRVSEDGAIKKEVVFPYQDAVNIDLSFAAPLLTRADRYQSYGYSGFPQQLVEIWSSGPSNKITLPVFHCDETYWDTLGVDSALPQPPKPRIPGGRQDYNDYAADTFAITVLIQVLGTSHYERDDMAEIDVLDRTFTVITDIAKKAVCLYESEGAAVVKRQNIYDSPKSGWEITLNLSE